MSQSQQRFKTSDSEERDVDELCEDDEDDKEQYEHFRIVDRLEAPTAMMFATDDLHKLIHQGSIDLTPPYQRDVVWTESKQMKLIDSLYHNYYVPPIVFAVVRHEETGDEVRRCVDGKQRLTSIQKFIDGQIPYKDPITKKNYWYVVSSHMPSRPEIPQAWKDDFAQKRIACVEYRNLPQGLERDIFQRVQLGIPLTAAEKLQAIASPWAEWVSNLNVQRVTSVTGIADQIDVDLSRGRDFQSVAQLVFCCDGIPEPRMPTANKLEQWLHRTDHPSTHFQASITKVLQKFWHLSSAKGLNDAFTEIKPRVAPVEFVFIGVLLFVMKECSDRECARAVLNLRREVRKEFKDIRTNSTVVKYLWDLIAREAEVYETGVYIDSPDAVKTSQRSRRTKKRQHADSDGEGNQYVQKSPVKRTPKAKKM